MNNPLYPIFLKTTKLKILIIGGGLVALEKLSFLLKSSPQSIITLVAPKIHNSIFSFKKKYNINIIEDIYNEEYLNNKHIVIATTNNEKTNLQIFNDCRNRRTLVNVADNPLFCDFYMGSIVTKGNLKIAISTNGKSPIIAKRFREILEEVLPDEIDYLLVQLNKYRKKLQVNFEKKLEILNKITS